MRKRKPNSQSVKSWARYLLRIGRAPVNIRKPERYLNSKARGILGSEIVSAWDEKPS